MTTPLDDPTSAATALAEETLDALVSVLDEIRSSGSRSRAELVEVTGLTRGVVAQRVGELLEIGLIVENEVGPSTGGRPPRRFSFRADAGHLLVADLGATSIDVAVTDLDGRILGHRDEPVDVATGPERCLSRIEDLFAEMTAVTRDLPGRLWGIGIGVPGPDCRHPDAASTIRSARGSPSCG